MDNDKRREYNQRYYLKHRQALIEAEGARRAANRETINAARRDARASWGGEGREKDRAQQHASYVRHREVRLAEVAEYRGSLRERVFAHYGTACACCGTTENLSIDHIDGNGTEHRQQIGKNKLGVHFYRWLIENNFPPGFQALCRGCNSSKRGGSRCRLQHQEGGG
jgi:hypothetical protein